MNRSPVRISNYIPDAAGNVALTFALVTPLILAGAGAGIDATGFLAAKSALQQIADGAALSGARQYFLEASNETAVEGVAISNAEAALQANTKSLEAAVSAHADASGASVEVSIDATYKPALMAGFFKDGLEFSVTSYAEARGSNASTCVIGLETEAKSTVFLNGAAKINGPNCAVYSNSTASSGVEVLRDAKIVSALTCSSGGYFGGAGNYSSQPLTDCPPREDPLANRPEPSVGACNYNRRQLDNFTGALEPGVYCGGLVINGASNVTLKPGIYVFKDGPFNVLRTSKVTGKNVGLYFTGRNADLYLQEQSDITLSGPVSGPMAGVLIWQENDPRSAKMFEVRSNNVHTLTGTIYLPNSTFYASVDAQVAQSSAYTAVVARKISLDGNVELVLNDDYGDTDVPVPTGVGRGVGEIALRR
jgi:Flp pilus assembly protein TadG